ncbi:MAG: ACP S-malonyltransferase [Pseudonocardia sp.]|nr:ACP S-malonyltransferase [Pseudonocardia sp.]
MIALLAPGQGSQKPGMLGQWLTGPRAEQTEAAETIARWSEAAELDLAQLGTTATADEIKDTAVTQPLVVATSLLAYRQLLLALGNAPLPATLPAGAPAAGHSVGELVAAAVAGALTADAAVELAAVRGREMAAACAMVETGMVVVLGGAFDQVLERMNELGLRPANINGAGQVVAAGPRSSLQQLTAEPPANARVVQLAVAGAFHTPYMAPAEDALRGHADKVEFASPSRPLLSNADGTVVTDGAELRSRLVAQVTLPVRWDLCMATLAELGVGATVELPPAGALTGLIKRELKGMKTVAVKSPNDLDTVVALVADEQQEA